MSESRAKRERKAMANTPKPKEKKKIFTAQNIIAVLVIAAVAALGVWAAADKIAPAPSTPQETEEASATVATIADSEGVSPEEFLEKCGLADSGLTADSTQEELYGILTVENYAKYTGKTPEELKSEYKIEGVSNDTLWSDAQNEVPMSKVAELYGLSFDEFAQQNSLPEEITPETRQKDAWDIMQAQMQVQEEPQAEPQE